MFLLQKNLKYLELLFGKTDNPIAGGFMELDGIESEVFNDYNDCGVRNVGKWNGL
ncbi:MAG: hypothetical protein H6620_12330 [Halobacteriovoraceae bacterium]|nr:hypothetical protein [Halobacteriovoraceae bacterium]